MGTSPRPEFILDSNAVVIGQDGGVLGRDGPCGRCRLVLALPVPGRQVRQAGIVADPLLGYLGDDGGGVLGSAGVWVSRILDAEAVIDTRSLG